MQLAAIVLDYVAARHERAARLFHSRTALRIQYPMLASIVVLTCGAVAPVLPP
ncbi:hypothetical protein EV383_2486 [Pseudonocardia sediminis]|uniref:Uncharacterized protein n=1 Tax=Pseudonocardia sediminis TaxID=1397368 RepID=A0A4Q7UXF0_PSEST|nr:hypothetical protein [Pseudonocardia sediminis]RZT85611.1 hypothetical protein EV383_2486 [Pseudonocardia sediminis]